MSNLWNQYDILGYTSLAYMVARLESLPKPKGSLPEMRLWSRFLFDFMLVFYFTKPAITYIDFNLVRFAIVFGRGPLTLL
jgi:hypothetical protein